jgi:hypothetical protein
VQGIPHGCEGCLKHAIMVQDERERRRCKVDHKAVKVV